MKDLLCLTSANEQVELVPIFLPRTIAIQPAGWLAGPHFRWPPVFPQAAVPFHGPLDVLCRGCKGAT